MEYALLCKFCNSCLPNSWMLQTQGRKGRRNHENSYIRGFKTRPLFAQTNLSSYEVSFRSDNCALYYCRQNWQVVSIDLMRNK